MLDATYPAPPDATPARPGIGQRLSQMIQVETVSAERDTRGDAPFEQFQALLEQLYPLIHERLVKEVFSDSAVVWRWDSPTEPAGDPALLMAHYDVVPVAGQEAEWSRPPFSGAIEDGAVWGRGALDDKGALCVLLDAVENLLAEGFVPRRTVYLLLGADEEVFGDVASEVATALHERGITPWIVVDEGGAITEVPLPGIDGLYALVGLGEKGILGVELSTTGTGGHASAPPRLTAVGRLSRAVARINSNPFPIRMSRTVRDMLFALAPYATSAWTRRAITAAASFPVLTERALAAAGGEVAAMVRTTIAPTMLGGGVGHNVLPSSARAVINLRLNIGETVVGAVARLQAAIGDQRVEIKVLEGYDPTVESPTDNAQYALLRESVNQAYPGLATIPYLTMAATDARHWHRFSPAVYRFAPLAMTNQQRASVHGVNENVGIEALERGERFYRALLQGLPAAQ
jgi:carboxypeptidase PM20D1